jgi:hypothetical protein
VENGVETLQASRGSCSVPFTYRRCPGLPIQRGGSQEVRRRGSIVKHTIRYAVTVAFVGYALLALSAVAVTLLVGLATGHYPSFTFFTLALLAFRLTEIHWTLLLFPLLAAACAMILLSKTGVNRRIGAGLGLSSPYLLVALVYALMGAGEFPPEIAIPWIVWAFLVGAASSIAVDRFRFGWA